MKNINRHVITGAIITDYEEMLQRLKNYLTIEALKNGLTASLSTNACQYSTDGVTWTDLPAGTTTPAINTGEKISFKATGLTPTSSAGIGTFTVNKQFNLSGNCMSMLFGDEAESNFDLTGYNYAFYGLFRNCTTLKSVSAEFLPAMTLADRCYYSIFSGCTGLTTAPELPATTLATYCYSNMFYGCTGLTTAPELPATTLAAYCYFSMFSGCTGLTTAPELPATRLSNHCYRLMFRDCTSLTTAPELPATTLSNQCYNSMFYGCTGLTTAPELPATRMVHWCYTYMFTGCTSLTTAPELPATTLADACYKSMFSGCTALTTAPEILPATTLTLTCYEFMFSGCTALTTAPELPATTLAGSCYNGMFKNCTALTAAPELPATTLASNCYNGMFTNTNVLPDCTNIDFSSSTVVQSEGLKGLFAGTKVTDSYLRSILPINPDTGNYWLPVTTLASNCYEYMFSGCTSLTAAPELPATTLASYCYQYMFSGCTSLITAPEILPATTLNNWCYYYMFQGCTGLTTVPELPATTLEYECYYYMFEGCTKLNYIKMLATDISASRCLYNWVSDVASSGTFVKNADATWDVTGTSGVPEGWTVKPHFTPLRCISLSITADDVSGRSTNTIIYWTAEVEGVDDKGNNMIVTNTGTDISESFPQNISTTDTIERIISYTYMGVTATTTITQGIWVDAEYTVNLNNQWQSSSVANPDSSLYDGVYESFSNKGVHNTAAIMYIDINGYNNFDLYIRSYAESSYDYVMVSQLDQNINNSTSYSNTTLIKAHTRGNQKSGTSIDNYTKVSFAGIDGGQHRITIVYRKDSSSNSGDDRGYVLIPKNQ